VPALADALTQDKPVIKSEDAALVTSDILKRAESVIFHKRAPPETRRDEPRSPPAKQPRKTSGKIEEITAPEKSKG